MDDNNGGKKNAYIPSPEKMAPLVRVCSKMAHDLNNTLGSIEGYCSMAESGLAPGSQALADLKGVRAAWAEASDLVRRLQAFAVRRTSAMEVCDIRPALLAAASVAGPGWEGIKVNAAIAALPPLRANPAALAHALKELLENARDAMPAGGNITVAAALVTLSGAGIAAPGPGPGPAPFVRISVSDTGAGVAPADMERLFEPFFSTRRRRGLGLAAVYGAALQHGGWTEVRSAPGEGSEFAVYVPAH